MQKEMIQIVADKETKALFIEESKKLKISLSGFLRLCAIEKINREAVNQN